MDGYHYLKQQLGKKNCTHIVGGLEIVNISPRDNGTDPDLSFLSHIREITGFLYINNVTINRLEFLNLRVIRGQSLFPVIKPTTNETINAAMLVENNNRHRRANRWFFTKILSFPKLKSIVRGDVVIRQNYRLCYVPEKINWDVIFEDSALSKLHYLKDPKNMCRYDKDVKCSERCEPIDGKRYCYGNLPNDCQISNLCRQKETCNSRRCNMRTPMSNVTSAIEECCHNQCLGGCYGTEADKCIACKNSLNGDQCVEACPKRVIYREHRLVKNPDFRYTFGPFCVKSCPKAFSVEEDSCVIECSQTNAFSINGECKTCNGENCPKKCILTPSKGRRAINFVTAGNIKILRNCTHLQGDIVINEMTFKGDTYTNSSPITNIEELYSGLGSMKEITGKLRIGPLPAGLLRSFSFLQNLEKIGGEVTQGSENSAAIQISSTDVEFFGFKKLLTVGNAWSRVVLNGLTNVCYLPVKHLVSITESKMISMANVFPPEKCIALNRTCDENCDEDKGCWGPGSKYCVACKKLQAGDSCVQECTDMEGYFYNKSINNCQSCHALCESGCNGSAPWQCIGACRYGRENGVCVRQCSLNRYLNVSSGECLSCSEYCDDSVIHREQRPACSGPSRYPGLNGCTRCKIIVMDRANTFQYCQTVNCSAGTYLSPRLNDPISDKLVAANNKHYLACLTCPDLCPLCEGPYLDRKHCHKCNGYWYSDICVPTCPKMSTYRVINSSHDSKECFTCDPKCVMGCHGPGANNCSSIFALIAGIVAALVVLISLVLVVVCYCWRKRLQEEKLIQQLRNTFSNVDAPDFQALQESNMDGYTPNLGRLILINCDDLEFENLDRPLGSGAFGCVYKGYWYVPREHCEEKRRVWLPVAIKVIHNLASCNSGETSYPAPPSPLDEILSEIRVMASVEHQHCLRLIGACLLNDRYYLLSAYRPLGSLDRYLRNNKFHLSSFVLLNWGAQIADGMAYLEMRGIIHRDLATRNVLLVDENLVQITDFGLAKMISNRRDAEIIVRTGRAPIRWLALETLREGRYSHSTDVWAFGVTMWEVFTFGQCPYENVETVDIKDHVEKGERLCQPSICTLDVYMVLVKCWMEDPNIRPAFKELVSTFHLFSQNPGRYLCIKGDLYNLSDQDRNEFQMQQVPLMISPCAIQRYTRENQIHLSPIIYERSNSKRQPHTSHSSQDEDMFYPEQTSHTKSPPPCLQDSAGYLVASSNPIDDISFRARGSSISRSTNDNHKRLSGPFDFSSCNFSPSHKGYDSDNKSPHYVPPMTEKNSMDHLLTPSSSNQINKYDNANQNGSILYPDLYCEVNYSHSDYQSPTFPSSSNYV